MSSNGSAPPGGLKITVQVIGVKSTPSILHPVHLFEEEKATIAQLESGLFTPAVMVQIPGAPAHRIVVIRRKPLTYAIGFGDTALGEVEWKDSSRTRGEGENPDADVYYEGAHFELASRHPQGLVWALVDAVGRDILTVTLPKERTGRCDLTTIGPLPLPLLILVYYAVYRRVKNNNRILRWFMPV
ncbi:MAG: hypothetical protein HY326_04580 [Chloroflexi bacterium]|nr:hypothetical protein [Chloroflexota bacterium]